MYLDFKDWVRLVGFIFIMLGLVCLPMPIGANPKADQSAFRQVASHGSFLYAALPLMAVGSIIFLGSFIKMNGEKNK
jgi:hypothetical protein